MTITSVNSKEYQLKVQNKQPPDQAVLPEVSVVIPLLNEEESLLPLFHRLDQALRQTGRRYEIIFVDDGSTDRTYATLQYISSISPNVWTVRFRRNFGQTAAFSAGFDLARGQVIITLDGDLQNDPNDIALLLTKIDEGYDVVSGWRIHRKDRLMTRRLPSQIANALISKVTGVRLHDYGCSLKAYRSEVIKNIRLYGDLHRFIPALASWMGVKVAEVAVTHFPRRFGKSKYGLKRIPKVILDLLMVKFLVDYSSRPIQIFGFWGLVSFLIGIALTLYLAVGRIFFSMPLSDRPILFLGGLLILTGVQMISIGLVGELVMRTYHETQRKPIYSIKDILEPGQNGTVVERRVPAEPADRIQPWKDENKSAAKSPTPLPKEV